MVDEASVNEVRESLLAAGVDEKKVDEFLAEVKNYNDTVGDIGQVKEGFKLSDELIPFYDTMAADEKWLAKNSDFVGYDCRMTAFLLANDAISVGNPSKEESANLFVDNEAIEYSGNPNFTDENKAKFNTIFASIPAERSKDINVHLSEMKKHFEDAKISFNNPNLSLVTVCRHDDIDDMMFVGHTGILVPSVHGDSLLFIEKISFQEPYQALKFRNRAELSDYLVNKYDLYIPEETARDFVMENAELIEGFRPNPNTK